MARLTAAALAATLLVMPAAALAPAARADEPPTGLSAGDVLPDRRNFTVATVGSQVLVAGGLSCPRGKCQITDAVDVYDGSGFAWSTAHLSRARYGLIAATAGSQVLFAGGFEDGVGGNLQDAVDLYDSSTGTWSTAQLSQARDLLVAGSVGTQILVAGGGTARAYSDIVDIYDTATGSWSTGQLSQPGRTRIVTVGQQALLLQDARSPAHGTLVDIYDASTGEWSSHIEPAVLRKPVVIGGQVLFPSRGSGMLPRYESTTGSWSTLRMAAGHEDSAVIGTQVLFAGGSEVVDILDTATGQWSTGKLGQVRHGMATATVGQFVLFAGGFTTQDDDQVSDKVDIYDTSTRQWSTAVLSEARAKIAVTVVGSTAVFAGGAIPTMHLIGRQGYAGSAAVEIFDSTTGSWSIAKLSTPRVVTNVAELGNQTLLIGGNIPCTGCGGSQWFGPLVDIFYLP